MNKKLLALYGLKYNPFSPEVPTEALHVTPKVDNFCWRIEQSLIRDEGLEVNVSKTGRVLVFEWTDELRHVIDRVRSLRRRIGSLYLFSSRKGLPYKVSGFDSIWQRAVKRSGLSNLTFHDLRAKALTEAQKKRGRDYAQLLADHESGNTTERYIRGRERRTVLPLK